ncbi:unnamed protein product [Gadus morhua 'NCC']
MGGSGASSPSWGPDVVPERDRSSQSRNSAAQLRGNTDVRPFDVELLPLPLHHILFNEDKLRIHLPFKF